MNPKRAASAGYRFSVIPAGAIVDPDISPRALQVLCLLGRHTDNHGWCTRSQVKMAEELHCVRSTIQKALEGLEESGYLERRAMGRKNAAPDPGKQPFASYAYRVILDVEGGADIPAPHDNGQNIGGGAAEIPPQGADRTARGCRSGSARGCRSGSAPHIYNIPLKEHALSNLARGTGPHAKSERAAAQPDAQNATEHPSVGGHSLMAAWDDIWAAYSVVPGFSPAMSEARAKSALEALIGEGGALPNPADLIAAIGVYAREVAVSNAARRKPMFIPHPHTWLSEKRWQQYLEPAANSRNQAKCMEAKARTAAEGLGEAGFGKLIAAGLTFAEISAWFDGAVGEVDADGPVIRAPSPFRARAIEERFLEKLRGAAAFGPKLAVSVRA